MSFVLGYKCSLCGAEYALGEVEYICPKHGDMGNLDVMLDYAAINRASSPATVGESRDFSIWRYAPLLPVENRGFGESNGSNPLFSVGWTPLYRAKRVAASLGLRHVWIKDDGRNPTASFKDRASAVAVVRALEIGAKVITTASSGNAGAALAGMAAAVGLPAVIMVPQTAPQAKVAQLLMFGATVILVKGPYDDAFDLNLKSAKEFGWYCRSTGYNPFTLEGKKTAAFEICEQLGRNPNSKAQTPKWQAPDRIFVSVGDGNIISGIHKGLKDSFALGWIDKMPKLMGVQAERSAAVYNAWKAGTETIAPVDATTIADSISVNLPRDGVRAVRAATQTGGAYVAVSDDEILGAMRDLARGVAVFAEPAGATAYAGLVKAVREKMIDPNESIVVVNTGNGLKDVKSAMQAAGEAVRIDPTLDEVRRVIEARK
ncbi:MAG: threonine synthase [Chloroflexi bacterium]|nr:threonine synthase [Chloroflexota bacterium]